ncbi:hypothetical protein AAC387_Pa08g1292 [Persea americana]
MGSLHGLLLLLLFLVRPACTSLYLKSAATAAPIPQPATDLLVSSCSYTFSLHLHCPTCKSYVAGRAEGEERVALIWEEQQQWPLASGGTGNGRQMNNGSKRPLDWELCRWPQDVCRSWPLESVGIWPLRQEGVQWQSVMHREKSR